MPAAVAEAAAAAMAGIEFGHAFEIHLRDRHEHHLGDTFAHFDGKRLGPAIPAGHEHLPLVIRIDQADQITQHDAVFMTQAGARQQHRSQMRIVDMDRQTGRNQRGLAGLQRYRLLQTGAQIQSGRTRRGVSGNAICSPKRGSRIFSWIFLMHSLGNQLQQLHGQTGFVGHLQRLAAVPPKHLQGVALGIEAAFGPAHPVSGNHVQIFTAQLAQRVVFQIFGFGGKTHYPGLGLQRGNIGDDVRILFQLNHIGAGFGFFQLMRGDLLGPVVCNRRGTDINVGIAASFQYSSCICNAVSTSTNSAPVGAGNCTGPLTKVTSAPAATAARASA